MTDDLIERLAKEAVPVRRHALVTRLVMALAIGTLVAAAVMVPWIGLRADIATAWADPIFWIKFGYTLLLALGGFWALERLARPGESARGAAFAIAATFAAAVLLGVVQMLAMPREMMPDLLFGGTNLVCPLYIAALSMPALAATMAVTRRLAPTRLTLAGLAAGLVSGGAGAWVYSFHCGENGLPFLAIWYTLGVAIVALAGALLGRVLLRW